MLSNLATRFSPALLRTPVRRFYAKAGPNDGELGLVERIYGAMADLDGYREGINANKAAITSLTQEVTGLKTSLAQEVAGLKKKISEEAWSGELKQVSMFAKDLNGRLESAESGLQSVKFQLEKSENAVQAQVGELESLSDDVTALQAGVTKLQGVPDSSLAVKELQEGVGPMKDQLNTLQKKHNLAQEEFEELETTVKSLTERFALDSTKLANTYDEKMIKQLAASSTQLTEHELKYRRLENELKMIVSNKENELSQVAANCQLAVARKVEGALDRFREDAQVAIKGAHTGYLYYLYGITGLLAVDSLYHIGSHVFPGAKSWFARERSQVPVMEKAEPEKDMKEEGEQCRQCTIESKC